MRSIVTGCLTWLSLLKMRVLFAIPPPRTRTSSSAAAISRGGGSPVTGRERERLLQVDGDYFVILYRRNR